MMVRCPYCGSERGFGSLKAWSFRLYHATLLQYENCNGKSNYHHEVSPGAGKVSEFVVRIRPRVRK
jgi:hypothetical protein